MMDDAAAPLLGGEGKADAEPAAHPSMECVASHAKKKRTKGHATVSVAGAKGGGGVLGIAVEGKDEGVGGNGGGGGADLCACM